MIQIGNEHLEVCVSAKGAELQSIKKAAQPGEFLWQGDPQFWNRKAPLLFPFVGKLKNDSYTFCGQTYRMPQHGFARDMNFSIVSQEKDQCSLLLENSEESLQLYPFPFRLEAAYRLDQKMLSCSYTVTNSGNKQMYFSLGGHPGFNCSMEDELSLIFEKKEVLPRWLLKEGLFTGETEELINGRRLDLNEELFSKDAIVLKNPSSSFVELRAARKNWGLRVHLNDFPYLGIWKKPHAGFLCIEPWHGLADSHQHTGELQQKEGIRCLSAGQKFETSYQIEII
jgi:galactose mutarotase-like enzyme